jgi:hypothetical protein
MAEPAQCFRALVGIFTVLQQFALLIDGGQNITLFWSWVLSKGPELWGGINVVPRAGVGSVWAYVIGPATGFRERLG